MHVRAADRPLINGVGQGAHAAPPQLEAHTHTYKKGNYVYCNLKTHIANTLSCTQSVHEFCIL